MEKRDANKLYYYYVDTNLTESWIEVANNGAGPRTPERVTPPLPFSSGDEYLRLLKEAQRESNQSSRVVSVSNSRRDSPRDRYVFVKIIIILFLLNRLYFPVQNLHQIAQTQNYVMMKILKAFILIIGIR